MRPGASSEEIRRRMQRQARRDTKPELALRRELWRRGLRYRVDVAPISGLRRRADMVLSRARVAVYVDGCYWHSCPEHATVPKANREWWIAKLEANVARDRDTDARLTAAGWKVVRVWEHEPIEDAADRIEAVVRLRSRRTPTMPGRSTGHK
jgi:DNA mismatch endonuclease (patch repair protein)